MTLANELKRERDVIDLDCEDSPKIRKLEHSSSSSSETVPKTVPETVPETEVIPQQTTFSVALVILEEDACDSKVHYKSGLSIDLVNVVKALHGRVNIADDDLKLAHDLVLDSDDLCKWLTACDTLDAHDRKKFDKRMARVISTASAESVDLFNRCKSLLAGPSPGESEADEEGWSAWKPAGTQGEARAVDFLFFFCNYA